MRLSKKIILIVDDESTNALILKVKERWKETDLVNK